MLVLALFVTAAPALGAEQRTQAPAESAGKKIDPQADRILRQMSDFLAAQRAFTVHTEGSQDIVLDSGQKIEFDRAGDVRVQRPDRLRVDRSGSLANLHVYYDGRQFTLHGEGSNAYATVAAPPTLDATLEMASELLGVEPPGADLLFSNPYATLIEDVRSGSYVGRTTIGGVAVHHLAFRNRGGVDWQLWVEDGPQPLPRKYVVTSRNLASSPEYSVTLSDWNLSPRIAQQEFQFSPPAGAIRVSFLARNPQEGEKETGEKQQPGEQQQGGVK